jgi:hypothetical protein
VADWVNISHHQHFWEVYQDLLDESELEDEENEDDTTSTGGEKKNSPTSALTKASKIRIRSVYEPDIARIVYMIQR